MLRLVFITSRASPSTDAARYVAIRWRVDTLSLEPLSSDSAYASALLRLIVSTPWLENKEGNRSKESEYSYGVE